jgi:hypothetical protein
MSAATTVDTTSITPDQLFDWAEATYPQFFPTREKTLTWSVYQFRYYKDTDVYLAVESGTKVVALGRPTNNKVLELGPIILFTDIVFRRHLFSDTPVLLPNIAEKVTKYCPALSINVMVPLDLNGDRLVDLIFQCWDGIDPTNQFYAGPTPNVLFVLIQQASGNFIDRTIEYLGSDSASFEGAAYSYAIGELNGDGKPDIVFDLNREDGRRCSDSRCSNVRTPNAALISTPSGYRVEHFGDPRWNDGVSIYKDANGRSIVVTTIADGIEGHGWFRSQNGVWTKESGYEWAMKQTTVFFNTDPLGKLAASSTNDPILAGPVQVDLWKDVNNRWEKISSYIAPKGPFITISRPSLNPFDPRVTSYGPIWLLNNEPHFTSYVGGFGSSCSFRRYKDRTPELIYGINTLKLPGKLADYKDGGQYLDLKYEMQFFLLGFSIDSRLQVNLSDIKVRNNNPDPSNNWIRCVDINSDGLDDVSIRGLLDPSKRPTVMLNDSGNNLSRIDPALFPVPERGDVYLYQDFDGDGISDLLYYPICCSYNIKHGEPVRFRFYKGRQNPSSIHLMPALGG